MAEVHDFECSGQRLSVAASLEAKISDTVLAFPGPCFPVCPWEKAQRGNQGR